MLDARAAQLVSVAAEPRGCLFTVATRFTDNTVVDHGIFGTLTAAAAAVPAALARFTSETSDVNTIEAWHDSLLLSISTNRLGLASAI